MKRFLIMIVAGTLCVLLAVQTSVVCTPTSYRYYGTQSYNYVTNAPPYAKEFVRKNIRPLKATDDYTKAVCILSIVCANMTYDYTALVNKPSMRRANDIDNFFTKGTGICWCYSRAYVYLCREAGLRAYEIVGYAGGACHAWCAVYINGVRYYVDPCWYDCGASFEQTFSNKLLPNHTFTYL